MKFEKYLAKISFKAIYTTSRTSSAIYFFLGLGVYISYVLTACRNKNPVHHNDVEPSWMLAYLYCASILYLAAILCIFSKEEHSRHCSHSHGSAFVRQGAVVFGLGAVLYTLLEFLSSVLSNRVKNSECHSTINTLNPFLLLIFIVLQMLMVVFHPRLNLRFKHGLSQFGLMHLILTNAILWIRTIMKESMLEFYEVEEREQDELQKLTGTESNSTLSRRVQHLQHFEEMKNGQGYLCYEDLEENYPNLYHVFQNWTPTLFPFVIEFSLIGCTMFFSMWTYVHVDKDAASQRYSLNVKQFLKSLDFTHSLRGLVLGCILVCLNMINLVLFFEYSSLDDSKDEFISKCANSAVNFCGSVASVMAIIKMQQLKDKEHPGGGMDSVLLYVSGAFLLLYSVLEIMVGANFKSENTAGSGYLHLQIVNGVFSVTSTVLQIIFIHLTFIKGHDESDDEKEKREIDYPARQETVFLSLTNFSQWLIFTFEIQKNKSSRTESEFFGAFQWVILQRIIMPLSIFFRFHSTVVLVDSWKNNYPNNKKRLHQQLVADSEMVVLAAVSVDQAGESGDDALN